jgi:hypothetical protein
MSRHDAAYDGGGVGVIDGSPSPSVVGDVINTSFIVVVDVVVGGASSS